MGIFGIIKGLLHDEAAKGQKVKVLAKFIGAHIRFIFRDSFIFSWVNSINMYAVKHRQSSTECYYYGLYDPMEMRFASKYIKKGDVFADVGSNIGSWALFAASLGAEVYAIEPTPSTFNLLKNNIQINKNLQSKITPVNSAVGESEGRLLFAIDRDSENRVVTEEESKSMKTAIVPCNTLDNICDKNVEIVKIDVENYEIPALNGWKKMLSLGYPNVIIIEAFGNYEQIKQFLSEYGFNQYKYNYFDNTLSKDSGRSNGNNVLFIRDIEKVKNRTGCVVTN